MAAVKKGDTRKDGGVTKQGLQRRLNALMRSKNKEIRDLQKKSESHVERGMELAGNVVDLKHENEILVDNVKSKNLDIEKRDEAINERESVIDNLSKQCRVEQQAKNDALAQCEMLDRERDKLRRHIAAIEMMAGAIK